MLGDTNALGVELEGGHTAVVRIGNTIRKLRHENSEFVEALLMHFEAQGFKGAPRFLGIDEEGRQILRMWRATPRGIALSRQAYGAMKRWLILRS